MPLSRLPSLKSLRAFEAAARRGSFKDAAAELFVTPGAISQQIKSLEDELGVPLFVRKTRAIQLTAQGQQLQPTLSEAFLQIRQSVDEVRPEKAPRLVIRSSNALISKWLLPRLHKFTKANPQLQVHIESELSADQGHKGEPDIEIRYQSAPPETFYAEVLHRELMLVVASPVVLETHGVNTPQDIGNAPVLYDTTPMLRDPRPSWSVWSKHAGFEELVDPSKAVRLESPPGGQVVDAAISGVGLAICGSLLVYGALSDGRLVCPFGPAVETGFTYFLCCRKGLEKKKHIHAFLTWAHEEAAILSTLNAYLEPSA